MKKSQNILNTGTLSNKIIVNVTDTCYNILLLENNEVVEYHRELKDTKYIVGDIFLGKINKIIAGFNVAFVQIGHEKDSFLHYSDLSPHMPSLDSFVKKTMKTKKVQDLTSLELDSPTDKHGKIKDFLKNGQQILVQVAKEALHPKGLRVSSNISLPGRYLILVPFSDVVTISKKIEKISERTRLKKLIHSIKPKNFGVIVRTASQGKDVAILYNDLQTLSQKWNEGMQKLTTAKPGDCIIAELRATASILRDIYNDSFDKIIVDEKNTYEQIQTYLKKILPERKKVAYLYQGKRTIFQYLNLDHKLDQLFAKIIGVKGGGYIVIEQTEAMWSIDVNTGSCMNETKDKEEISLAVNLASTEEIVRQIRLRNIGGIVTIDFVSMLSLENKRAVYQKMKECLKGDTAKSEILPLNKFCVMLLTRSRLRPAISFENKEICPTCSGSGKIQSSMNIIHLLEEQIKQLIAKHKLRNLTIRVHPYLYAYLNQGLWSKKREWFLNYWQWINIVQDETLAVTEYKILNSKKELIAKNPQLEQTTLPQIL